MSKEGLRSDKMGTEPIGKLLISMSVPAMLSMLVQALYNVVDTIFVGMYSGAARNALNLAMPFQMIPLAFALGIGVGTNAAAAKALGEGNPKKASKYVQTGLVMSILAYIVFIFVGIFVSGVFATGLSNGDKALADLTTRYLFIVVTFSGFMFAETLLSKSLQATGNMIAPMIAQLIGAITNIILDPIFIFVFEMGVEGAAIATVIGQACAMTFSLCVFIFKKQDVNFDFKDFKMEKESVMSILLVGIPTAVLNGLASVTTMLMYSILANNFATDILGSYFKVQSFVFMPVFGLNQGAMPIMSYNFGRVDKKRLMKTYWLSVGIASSILLCGMILFLTVPEFLLGLFNIQNPTELALGALAFRQIALCFIPAAFGIITITLLQATQNGVLAMCVSFCRQLIFLVPTAYLLKILTGGEYLNYIWLCYPIAEIFSVCISLPLARVFGQRAFEKNAKTRRQTLLSEQELTLESEQV